MAIDFAKMDGLVPAIIQDNKTLKVLMLGFMNEEAYQKTVETGKVTFWSRTKNRLWTKGETSGNFENPIMFLTELQRFIEKRHEEMPEGSYTTSLFKDGLSRMTQKVGEEAVELVIESMKGDNERMIYEASDMFYHLIVLLTSKGLSIEDIAKELIERHDPSWHKH